MFVKALFDASDKYNISVLDIINNTYEIEAIYNEPILKSNSDSVGVKLIYNPDDKGLAVYESNTIDDNNPTTIGDVVTLLTDTIKFDDILSELENEYKGKLIYGTSGLGKTTIANTTKNVIDSDNLKLQVIFEEYPYKMERGETVQKFIRRVSRLVDTISLNTKVFDKIKEKISQGYTVLTATRAFIRNADYVFTTDINNKRLLSRFGTIENLEPFLAEESEIIAKSEKPVQYVTNLEDVLIKKPKVERPETQNKITVKDRIDILENELKELENLKKDILSGTPEVLIANSIPKITPDSAKKETGGKIGVNQDINPNLLDKNGVSVERAAEDINNDYPDMDIQDIRNYIIDILQIGVTNFVNRYTNQNKIDSIKNEIAELKRNKTGQLDLFDNYDTPAFDDYCTK
jgi:nucleoside-triphosphatase THEP1